MINVLISGINGNMGKALYLCKTDKLNVACGVDKNRSGSFDCPVYRSFCEVKENVDIVIDFSSPEIFPELYKFVKASRCALLTGTTGIEKAEKEILIKLSKIVPVFASSNTSFGVNFLISLFKRISEPIDGLDIDIVEKHRKDKKDAPSGTALMLKDALINASEDEIRIHSLRAGDTVGEHEIIFTRGFETVTVKHVASSRRVFAEGAIKIAEKLPFMKKGLYTSEDFIRIF